MSPADEAARELLWRYVSGALEPHEEAAVRRLLSDHPEYADEILEMADDRLALETLLKSQKARGRLRWVGARSRVHPFWFAAAGLFLGFVLLLFLMRREEGRPVAGVAVPARDEGPVQSEEARPEGLVVRVEPEGKQPGEVEPRRSERPAPADSEQERRRIEAEMLETVRRARAGRGPSAPLQEAPPPRPETPIREPVRPGPRETRSGVAVLEKVEGQVGILDPASEAPARTGGVILDGQGVRTAGSDARAVVKFPDGTRLDLAADTEIREIDAGEAQGDRGKRLHVARGAVAAEVPRQPAGRPLVLVTPHAEALVLGTTLRIVVDDGPLGSTRLEVKEGRVRLTRLADGKMVDVMSGHYAVAAAGVDLASRPFPRVLFAEDFQRPQEFPARWRTFTSGPADRTALEQGALRMTLENAGGFWEHWYAVSRAGFPLGALRISARMRLSDAVDRLIGAVSLYSEADNGKGDRDHLEVYVDRKAVVLRSLRYPNGGSKNGPNLVLLEAGREHRSAPGHWIQVEFVVDPQDATVSVNGGRLYSGPHKIVDFRQIRIGLLGGLKQGIRTHFVEFDDVRVERLR